MIDRKTKNLLVMNIILFVFVIYNLIISSPSITPALYRALHIKSNEVSVTDEVLPKNGYITKIHFGNVIPRLVKNGVIDIQKLDENYSKKGGIPAQMKALLSGSSTDAIILTKENSNTLLTLLWPIGLSNKMKINEKSLIAGPNVGGYSSTGGWTLGRAQNGGTYFNTIKLLPLTLSQESRVKNIAENVHRPCCNNSAFFQDCNHGSAALGLIELGVSQGLRDSEIYKTVLAFNSFWFPQNYIETAVYFKKVKGISWKDIDPKLILSKNYSSITGWMTNVDRVMQKNPSLLPVVQGGSGCAV